jgi:hypothetical protein
VGYQQLDADSERRNLETALEPLSREGLVELTWLDRATLRDLGRRISEPDEIHVIHYIGHGAYSEQTEAGVLVLETPEGRAHDVTGEEMGAMLQDERTLRLVVLNSCDGARTSHIDPFSGVATSLIEFDIPAVVGMQFEITDLAAIAFSESLYSGLAQGMPIDAAVGPARRAIMAITTAEFGTPVLFLRDGDARLFDIDNDAVESRQSDKPSPVEEPVHLPVETEGVLAGAEAQDPVEETATFTDMILDPVKISDLVEEPAALTVTVQDDDEKPAIDTSAVGDSAAEPTGLTGEVPPVKPGAVAERKGSTLKARNSFALWIGAFIISGIVALIAWTGSVSSDPVPGFGWLIALGLAAAIGAIAAGLGAEQHRILGVVLPLLMYPIVLVTAALTTNSNSPEIIFSLLAATELILLVLARLLTKRRRTKDAPRT